MGINGNGNLRFTKIILKNWMNFATVDVDLPERTFLVGPNASGKSNFLDVFRFLHDLAKSVGGGLQSAVKERGGISHIRCLSARQESDVGVSVYLGNAGNPRQWLYELKLDFDKKDRAKRAIIRQERVERDGKEVLKRPDDKDEPDPELLTQTHLEQVMTNKEFRPIADLFSSIKYFHIVPQLIREPERIRELENDPYGSDFLKQVARTAKRTRDAALKRIASALRIALPKLNNLELWWDEDKRPHLRGNYEHWRSQGAWQMEEQFSDGTLRLIGLLWALLDEGGPLLLEEPELSLHPGVVRHIPQTFARIQNRMGRQVLISTHSSEMLDDEGIGLNEVLLLLPESEGSVIRPAAAFADIKILLESGHSLAEAVMPKTEPKNSEQLPLFSSSL